MIAILINVLTGVLILVAFFLGFVVLAQPAKSDAGMSGLGGGMMESTFGPDTSNVMTGLTIKATIVFFLLSFLIYLGYIYERAHPAAGRSVLPNISAPATLPAMPAAAPAKSTTMPAASVPAPAAATPAPATPAPNAAPTTKPGDATPKTP